MSSNQFATQRSRIAEPLHNAHLLHNVVQHHPKMSAITRPPFSCAPTRPGEGTAHTPHGQESGPVDRIYRALRPARQQPQQESLQPHRHTTGPAHQRRWQPIERGPHSHSAVTDRRKSARHQRTAPPSRLSSSATPIAGHGRRRR